MVQLLPHPRAFFSKTCQKLWSKTWSMTQPSFIQRWEWPRREELHSDFGAESRIDGRPCKIMIRRLMDPYSIEKKRTWLLTKKVVEGYGSSLFLRIVEKVTLGDNIISSIAVIWYFHTRLLNELVRPHGPQDDTSRGIHISTDFSTDPPTILTWLYHTTEWLEWDLS